MAYKPKPLGSIIDPIQQEPLCPKRERRLAPGLLTETPVARKRLDARFGVRARDVSKLRPEALPDAPPFRKVPVSCRARSPDASTSRSKAASTIGESPPVRLLAMAACIRSSASRASRGLAAARTCSSECIFAPFLNRTKRGAAICFQPPLPRPSRERGAPR